MKQFCFRGQKLPLGGVVVGISVESLGAAIERWLGRRSIWYQRANFGRDQYCGQWEDRPVFTNELGFRRGLTG